MYAVIYSGQAVAVFFALPHDAKTIFIFTPICADFVNKGFGMKKAKVFSLLAIVSMALAGCVGAPVTESVVSEDQQVDSVLGQLTAASKVAVNAQRERAMLTDAARAREAAKRERLLTDTVSYDYYGDMQRFLQEFAAKYGYGFESFGKRPPEGVLVNIFVQRRPAIEVLRAVGYQSSMVDVVLTSTTIEMHYKLPANAVGR